MTALPTLIRHTPGVLTPRLIFDKVEPLNDLLTTLGIAIKSTAPETIAELRSDADMAELLAQIQHKKPFASQHEGEEDIFHFLKGLNDLVRLCFSLNAVFPFDTYSSVDAMPVIEVEFSHLKNTPATQGRLTLLDTPGPNEAGQEHLRHMLKDQLKKASAVLAVLDYTQLKSDADAQVRENLMGISDTSKGRMYALVNKFDQKDRNSDDEKTVKQYVTQTLMKNTMPEDCVFPVSSLRGYLASRARNDIERHGKLPNDEPWVEDFGNLALGMAWDEHASTDAALMQKAADNLWKKSGFATPLEQVIVEAHRNAALEALRSAASKLDDIAKNAGNFFKANVGALKKSALELQKNIDNLQQDIDNITRIEKATEQALKETLAGMKSNVRASAEAVQKSISETVSAYFKEGKSIEASSQAKKASEQKPKEKETGHGIFSFFASAAIGKTEDPTQDFDPKSPIIKFDEKSEANDFREKIEKSIRNVMHKAEDEFKECIQSGINDFSKELGQHRTESLEKIKKSVQKNIEDFDIQINLPNARDVSLEISVSSILKDSIEEKTRTVTRHRRQSGAWGKVCSWFKTDDWGWESYKANEDYYQVDLEKIARSSNEGIKTLFSSANSALDREIYPQLQNCADDFFRAFREKVEHVRGDLISNIQKHSLDQNRKAAILKDSEQMAHEASGLGKDCSVLNDSAEILRREEGVSTALEMRT